MVDLARGDEKKIRNGNAFVSEVEVILSTKLFGILKSNIRIQETAYDPEMTATLFEEITKGYSDSPYLQVAWLDNLANFQKSVSFSSFLVTSNTKLTIAYVPLFRT